MGFVCELIVCELIVHKGCAGVDCVWGEKGCVYCPIYIVWCCSTHLHTHSQSDTLSSLDRARSPEKNTTNTDLSTRSAVAGSVTVPTGADLRNMLPRVARNNRRSKLNNLSLGMVPATNPKRRGAPRGPSSARSGAVVSPLSRAASSAALLAVARASSKKAPAFSRTSCSSRSSLLLRCRRSSLALSCSNSVSKSSSLLCVCVEGDVVVDGACHHGAHHVVDAL